jgi:hypothetical protein
MQYFILAQTRSIISQKIWEIFEFWLLAKKVNKKLIRKLS